MRSVVRRVPREKRGTQLRVLEPNVKYVSIDGDVEQGLEEGAREDKDQEENLMRVERSHANHAQSYAIPEVDWEQEVGAIMYDSDDASQEPPLDESAPTVSPPSANGVVLRRSLPLSAAGLDKDAPFACFEVGSVSMADAQRAGEYLDDFIPNRVTEDELRVFEIDDNEDDEDEEDGQEEEELVQDEGKASAMGKANGSADGGGDAKKEKGLGLSLNLSRKSKKDPVKETEKKRLQDEQREEDLLMKVSVGLSLGLG